MFQCFRFGVLFDENDGNGTGAPVTPPAAPVGGENGTPTPGAPGGTSVAPAAPPHAPTGFTYKEDRSNWVPSHVVRNHTERIRQYERDLAIEKQRVAALSGVATPVAVDPETAAIRKQLEAVYPELAELAKMKDKLAKAAEFDYDSVKQDREQSWAQRGTQALNQLASEIQTVYGTTELSEKALARYQRMFIAELQADDAMRQRYELGDPSVIKEFVKDITTGILDPFRRTAALPTSGQVAARRLPRQGGGSAIAGTPARTVKPTDGDAYHNAAFARFQQG